MRTSLLPKLAAGDFIADVEEKVGQGAVAVVLTDLDDFASINTDLGHQAGDDVLAAWQRTLLGSLPKEAIVARLGGDEYAVALPDHSAESALIVLEEIRSHFAANSPIEGRLVNASAGIAARPPHASTTEELLQAADAGLARAKREGRGRVAIYVEEKMVLKSNYYARAQLDRLAKTSRRTARTEASLLREALEDVLDKYRELS